MWPIYLLRSLKSGSRHNQRRGRRLERHPRQRFVPWLEGLESRTLLSTFTVLNNGDGSLRAMLALASSGDTIDFAPDLTGQTITLTNAELVINKSLDIEGLG